MLHNSLHFLYSPLLACSRSSDDVPWLALCTPRWARCSGVALYFARCARVLRTKNVNLSMIQACVCLRRKRRTVFVQKGMPFPTVPHLTHAHTTRTTPVRIVEGGMIKYHLAYSVSWVNEGQTPNRGRGGNAFSIPVEYTLLHAWTTSVRRLPLVREGCVRALQAWYNRDYKARPAPAFALKSTVFVGSAILNAL